ncbi:aminopeptidase [Flavobacterium rivuli WB 3.3-2 = DSM 21788]|uniref:Aminopeptidase N n=1 Tax=Flavobacterium rivuli WB 3.3-2 = DSM 21788 TaxID=1121895 RepID=A0A0A2M5M0_9FLAO|nr:M1 family metallopeptidase [Flavobacterium rivuli]KGO86718.1 aminopeptidase [Flavobacterium rivuli WB 3.3-2 = DSM 21788]
MKSCLKALALFSTTILFAQAQHPQQLKDVDFKTIDAYLTFDVSQKQVTGKVTYTFEVSSKPDTIYIDAHNMQFKDVKVNGKKKTGWAASASALKLFKGYKKGKNTVEFTYTAQPKQTLYFVRFDCPECNNTATTGPNGIGDSDVQIWTQGQGKYTSHWLPSFDDVNEKVIFNLSIGYEKGYEVMANGVLKSKSVQGNLQKWEYQMDKPMSSYLAMLTIGQFEHQSQTAATGTPLEFWYRPEDASKFGPTYRDSKRIFDFLEREIGVNYPWRIYRQVPVLDFLYAGMENTTSTIFSEDFVVDETGFNDRSYINVNAHELAHQWFGDLITAESGTHHWLQEGFATYFALLAEQELYGNDHFNYQLYEMAERLQQAAKTDTIPVMNEKASTLSFYQKGAWAVHVLREGIGHDVFKTAIKNYLEKYAYKNVNTDEFLAEINKVSSYDTASFKKRWLESPGFEVAEAIELLSKNQFMQLYLKLGELSDKRFEDKKPVFMQVLQSDQFYPVKQEVIFQTAKVPFADKAELVRYAMNTGDIKLRQAVARTVTTIPAEFEKEYITLLNDDSYITREVALNVLCRRFPERQGEFLDKGIHWIGFNDKNLRILWLTLAYAAKYYHPEKKADFYGELLQYASPRYESSVRQNALANLLYIGKADPIVWQNLLNATLHHKWQFVKFGKDNIRKLLKKEGYRTLFETMLPQLPEAEKKKLEQLLGEK